MCGGRTRPPSTSSGLAEPINIGTSKTRKEVVLVTGGTGFIASHCVEAALDKGYAVRTTVRNPSDERKCAHLLGLVAQGKPLELCKADLLKDEGWAEAVKGCSYVIHVASPVVAVPPKDESIIIDPAVQGTMRLLKAAEAAGVKRVVLTSSLAAVIASREEAIAASKVTVTDDTYAKLPEGRGKPYSKAKILQERAAWDFVRRPEAKGMELVVFCPGVVGGPVLNGNESESSMAITASFRKQMPFVPDVWVPQIDVRDLAAAHVVGMTHPKAAGERFLMVHETYTFPEFMRELAPVLRPLGYHVMTRTIGYNVARLAAGIEPRLKFTLYMMGIKKPLFDGSKARRVLGLPPYRKWRDHRLDAALSVIEQGHVPMTPQYKAAREVLKAFEVLASERSPYWAAEQEGDLLGKGDAKQAAAP